MKRLGWLVALVILSAPVWAVQKITVEQLKAMLAADKQAQKPDADVAAGTVHLSPHTVRCRLQGV